MTSCKCHKLQEGYFSVQRRFCADSNSEKLDPKLPSERSSVSNICPDAHMCREALIYSSLHLSGRFSSTSGRHSVFNQLWDFFSKTQIWEDSCNRPDDVDSQPDALIHKASRAFKIHTFERRSSWSRPASFIYENCVHQIHRPDDRCHVLDMPNLDMEIA
jgi:hypothetical protein